MDFYNGSDRILFIKVNGNYMPIGCLVDNSFDESAQFLSTTTRDNQGWETSRPIMQSYTIGFNGIQLNTTISGGNFSVASYDKLKQLKRDKMLLDWKIEGVIYPVVDYGQGYIASLSETNAIDEFMAFSGSITGYGKPLMRPIGETVLNTGNPDEWLNDGNPDEVIKIGE